DAPAHQRVVIDDQDLHYPLLSPSTGNRAVTLVPRPGAESTSSDPSTSSTRLRIIWSPKCRPSVSARVPAAVKPRPVSPTSTISSSRDALTYTVTFRASACLAALASASRMTTYAAASTGFDT